MVAALNVLRIVGQTADADFVAMDILPILWSMSLGPLLDLKQFQTFMELIKSLSKRVEEEQTRKLQELSGSNGAAPAIADDFMAFGGVTGTTFDQSNGATEDDFEALVKGRPSLASPAATNTTFGTWSEGSAAASSTTGSRSAASTPQAPTFSWSTPSRSGTPKPTGQAGSIRTQQGLSRTVTPDLARFESLTPGSTQFSQPLQPAQSGFQPPAAISSPSSSINWSTAGSGTANPWSSSTSSMPSTPNYQSSSTISPPPGAGGFGSAVGSMNSMSSSMGGMSLGQRPGALGTTGTTPSFSLPPPPTGGVSSMASRPSGFGGSMAASQPVQQSSGWSMAGTASQGSMASMMASRQGTNANSGASSMGGGQQKSGLDKYESLI
jgi:SCY1-like protein 2